MQNKCNCADAANFIPVTSNWDHNACGYGNGTYSRNTRRRNASGYRRSNGCSNCDSAAYSRCDECPCGNNNRSIQCCEENTYVREFDNDCGCNGSTYNRCSRSNGHDKCDECDSTYTRSNDCDECDTCNGSTYNRRSRSNGHDKCDECDSAYTRSNDCDECKENSTYQRSGKGNTVGMVYAARQKLDDIFESESALRSGTLFPELHKPLNGYCPCDSNCSTCEQEAAFAAWELRLYLNTHPNDKKALALFRRLWKETSEPNYATSFLDADACDTSWDWVDSPWPWECQACGK